MKGLLRALFTAMTLAISGMTPSVQAAGTGPSHVTTAKQPDGSYKYLVNGQPQVFIGMGYDPMYRFLPSEQRAANYRRDFQLLKKAGVNTITGWDADKGYEQDKFDELTLNLANEYGIGVVMPLNLPPEADYRDPNVVADLMAQGKAKVERFKDNPALRKAVNQVIDRRALLAQAGYLAGKRTDQILPPGLASFRDADLYPLKQPNLPLAKKLAQGHTGAARRERLCGCKSKAARAAGDRDHPARERDKCS